VGLHRGSADRRLRGRPGPRLTSEQVAHDLIERVFREESGRAVATLIRVLGDFDLAEEAVQDAFMRAIEVWPTDGVPANPGAWITTTARNRAIDRLRRRRTLAQKTEALGREAAVVGELGGGPWGGHIDVTDGVDDRLRLIFTCCHPALAPDARVALTLRMLGGLTTPEIARAFLVPEVTLAQRLVRAKRKIRDAAIPYRVPPVEVMPERLDGVLRVLYLIFNEGYSATSGDALVRRELASEAIRLARMLTGLMPDEPEATGLLALMLLHDARRDARTGPDGALVLLEAQDRARWDRAEIDEGQALLDRAIRMRRPGPYQLQAAIAALHDASTDATTTDWPQIAALYGRLAVVAPSPVVELNRAVAVAMSEGAAAGLELLRALEGEPALIGYPYFHAARADLLRRLGRDDDAVAAYRAALEHTTNDVERRFLAGRIAEVTAVPHPRAAANAPPTEHGSGQARA
jgi:RNA polymerase sigma-70 factor, ECF subfamily